MEERIMDEDELRGIKVKRNAIGGIEDAVEEGTGENAQAENEEIAQIEAEFEVKLPEVGEGDEEYDESLVGLTPEDLRAELERRKKVKLEAEKKCAKNLKEGEERLAIGNYPVALSYFEKALSYEPENEEAQKKYWTARTHNFSDDTPFTDSEAGELFATHTEGARAFVLNHVGEKLKTRLKEAEEEAEPLREKVQGGIAERRGAFAANRRYYVVRTAIFAVVFVAFLIACLVCADFIVRTKSITPVVLTAVFGGIAFLALLIDIFFICKLAAAIGLCRANEMLSSTEDGARLEVLDREIYALRAFLAE